MRTARALILLSLLCAAAGARAAEPYYFVAVHNGVPGSGGAVQLEESYKALQKMVQLADTQHVRLTLTFSAQYAAFISTEPARLAQLESWKNTGHEIGAYHQGPDTAEWDGFSDLRGDALTRVRSGKVTGPVPGHADYFFELSRLSANIRTGCMGGRADKDFLAAAPAYELCPGTGKPGGGAAAGVNKLMLVSGPGGEKKRLSSAYPYGRAGIEAAKKAFSAMKGGVYGAAFKSTPSEFGAFYAWLQFLKGGDPQGLRSRTAAAVAEEKLLTEKTIKERQAGKEKTGGSEKFVRTIVIPDAPPAPEAEEVADDDVPVGPAEERNTEIPRLKPVRSPYSRVERLFFGRFRPLRPPRSAPRRYCGDGICDMTERRRPGSCPRDCGR